MLVLCISPGLSSLTNTLSTLRFGMNAKRISNLVKNNVHETNNFSELKRLLRQYEEKIGHLEAEKIRERNQSEELLEMVRRLMAQKKELLEKLTELEPEDLEKLNCNGKNVISETIDLHQQLDGLLKRSNSTGSNADLGSHNSNLQQNLNFENNQEYVEVFRFQNIKLINRILKLRDSLKNRDSKTSKTVALLEGLLNDPNLLFSLSDKLLAKLKKKLVNSVSSIDEQLISRKLTKKLLNSLQATEVEVARKDEEFELLKEFSLNSDSQNCNCLGKRSEISKGMMKKDSIEAILRKTGLPCGQIYSDNTLPTPVKATLELIDCEDEVEEINFLNDEVNFNPEKVGHQALDVQIVNFSERNKQSKNKKKHSNKRVKKNGLIDLSKQRPTNCDDQIDLTCGLAEGDDLDVVELHLVPNEGSSCKPPISNESSSPERSKLSQESSLGFFKMQREPLAEKSNEPDPASFPEVVSPKSSLYYFTSKKNEYDFSFDRSAVKVEKNLGKALLMETIQKSMQKENNFRMQR